MSSMRGEFDLILAAIIAFSKSVPVRSTYQNRWVLDSVLSQLINEMIDGFDITTTKMNRALCGKQFKQIGDDSIVNSLLIYRRKFSVLALQATIVELIQVQFLSISFLLILCIQ